MMASYYSNKKLTRLPSTSFLYQPNTYTKFFIGDDMEIASKIVLPSALYSKLPTKSLSATLPTI